MRHHTPSITALVALATVLTSAEVASAQNSSTPAPQQGCAAPEFHQLDFWVGEWDATWQGGSGVNRITKILDGCVIQEDFDGGASTGNLVGRSVSTYDRNVGQWRQSWVDNQGGYFALVGGPVGDTFILSTTRITENAPYQRMVFEDIHDDSFTWRWQRSANSGATWTDAWVIAYRRRAPAN